MARRLHFRSRWNVPYDYLVIADAAPGTAGHAAASELSWPTPLACTHRESRHAWTQYQRFIKRSGPLVIAAAESGGGRPGAVYEFALLFDADLRQRNLRQRVPMTFITCEPRIGQMMSVVRSTVPGCWRRSFANDEFSGMSMPGASRSDPA